MTGKKFLGSGKEEGNYINCVIDYDAVVALVPNKDRKIFVTIGRHKYLGAYGITHWVAEDDIKPKGDKK